MKKKKINVLSCAASYAMLNQPGSGCRDSSCCDSTARLTQTEWMHFVGACVAIKLKPCKVSNLPNAGCKAALRVAKNACFLVLSYLRFLIPKAYKHFGTSLQALTST